MVSITRIYVRLELYKRRVGVEEYQVNLSDFDYDLPEELIAQDPCESRDGSRLMIVPLDRDEFEHRCFRDLLKYLRPGDNLVVNDTKVIPARLLGEKKVTGAKMEVLLLKKLEKDRWEALVRPGKRAPAGTGITFNGGLLECRILDDTVYGGRIVEFYYSGSFHEILNRVGLMPVPPYIKKPLSDRHRYQTVYAREAGSAAAPTAGLHFSPELLSSIRAMGVTITPVLLHVGLGTFRPVEVQDISLHHMHAEYYEISGKSAAAINLTKQQGGRVIAVGTTTTRCLESVAQEYGQIRPCSGWTDIFIYPGYRFQVIDGLVTNFHLPKSTLLMMVSALAGRDRILSAYKEAVRQKYRFFSFGDAMLIV
jgi:S-adenosylmethionine:tRNA ribosyltransferase-isomerase